MGLDRIAQARRLASVTRQVFPRQTSRPSSGGALGHARKRLLGGAAGIALPAASVVLALGVALPSDAQAQTSSFNGTQATTYTLTTGANTPTFTFGPAAVIGPTAPGTPGVTGDTITNWNVINQGQITGGGGGFSAAGIVLNTPGGNSVTNSGRITNGVYLFGSGNSSLANLAGGTITGNALVRSGTMTNAGTITGNVSSNDLTLTNSGNIGGNVYISRLGTVTNQTGDTITGGVTLSSSATHTPGTLTNAGAIGSGGTAANAVTFNGVGSLTNLSGGTLTGVTNGVYLFFGGTVTNQAGATITGGTDGVFVNALPTTVTNAGAITGTAGNGISLRGGGSVANQTGGTITGGVNGVYLSQNGGSASVANQAGGTIVGGTDGVKISANAGTSTVTNAGSITGTSGTGVSVMSNQVSVTNLAGATITGATGVYVNAVNATVTNAGTITGTGGTGILLGGSFSNILILQTGSVINGDAVVPFANGQLILRGTGTANNLFTGFFSGLDVQATGIWVLNNVNSLGGTTIESGALVIGDASHPGAQITSPQGVTVQPGATLGGQGTVDVSGGVSALVVAGGGTIAPGVASPFSTLNVIGNVVFNGGSPNSFFNVNVNAAGQTDKLALSGTGTLTGGTVQVLAQPGNYAGATSYTILTDGTRNSTTFAGVTVNSIFLTPTLTYPSQQQVVLTLSALPFSSAASTPNQTATANALNAGPFNALTGAIFGQTTTAGAQQAFNSLSGEIFGSVQNTLADETQLIRNAILGRLRQASYADDGGDLVALAAGGAALAFAEPSDNPLALVPPEAHADAHADAQAEPYLKAPARRDMTYWSQALGGFGRVNSDGNAAALTSSFGGVLTGFDARFGAVRAGVMAGYIQSNLNVDARASSAGIDSGSFGAYAGATFGAFRLRAGGSATFASIDTSRAIAFPGFSDTTRAHFSGGTGQAFGEIGYGMAFDRIAVEPFAGIAYLRVDTGSFLESGGLAALSGASDGENIGYASLGVRAASVWTLGGTALIPRGSIQWQHAFGDVVPTAALAFAATGAAFTVSGVPIAKDAALVDAGVDWRITPAIKVGVEYQGALAQTAQTHTAKGSFTWDF